MRPDSPPAPAGLDRVGLACVVHNHSGSEVLRQLVPSGLSLLVGRIGSLLPLIQVFGSAAMAADGPMAALQKRAACTAWRLVVVP